MPGEILRDLVNNHNMLNADLLALDEHITIPTNFVFHERDFFHDPLGVFEDL